MKQKLLKDFQLFKRSVLNRKNRVLEFKNYKAFHSYLAKAFAPYNNFAKPKDMQHTIKSTWQAMNRTATVIKEPIMEQVFNTQAEVMSNEDVRHLSDELRNKASDTLLTYSEKPDFKYLNLKQLFDDLDILFDLKGKMFSILQPEQAVELLPKNTSSAFPEFTEKRNLLTHVVNQANGVFYTGDTSWNNYPAVVSWRTQQRKTGTKFRQFYMFGYLPLTLEMCYIGNIFKHFNENKDTSYCFGNKFPQVKEKLIRLKRKYKYIYSFDFDSFDQNVTSTLLFLAFKYLKTKIAINSYTYNKIFDELMLYGSTCYVASKHNTTPSLFRKKRGVMSGSVLTNLLDSIINAIMLTVVSRRLGNKIEKDGFAIMGDDCLMGSDFRSEIVNLADYLSFKFDAILSVNKSMIYEQPFNSTIYFLGYEIDEDGRYADFELFKKQLIFSEQFIPESVLPTPVRLFSKMASICFKCTDGFKFWDKYVPILSDILNVQVPETFRQIYSITGEPINYSKEYLIDDYKYLGWLDQ